MAKREKIVLQYDSNMEAINAELAEAMDALDASVQRVDSVLREMAPVVQPPAPDPAQEPPSFQPPAE